MLRSGETAAKTIAAAREHAAHRQAAGFDQAALDEAARRCLANSAFEESIEEVVSITEEFFPDQEESKTDGAAHAAGMSLADKLKAKTDKAS